MLQHLRALHVEILRRLDQLDRLTQQAEPPIAELPAARLALSRASRARTLFIEQNLPEIIGSAPPSRLVRIRALQHDTALQMDRSANHVSTWSLQAIASDWPAYRRASAEIRDAMRLRIKEEAALLYPILSALPLQRLTG
ncbi:hypothetical protein GCM10011380_32500 [Sphingomonas metalli]|uniref:Uncharacterized protein n=1 Tax=Sphingomonas metalli TaxID=1779358 RepID=A0A916TEF2_9SPHN|nr:hypothetical protein [Sphingomonas metalli]GGB40517.1 hypothetical protein GCM10011380_32500 [Sphingomonas metalli]